ncbi:MAG: DNA primase [Archaeoglobus sp.]|jgi:DNA primase catalytic subunit|nr:DNA primase [Archaeoglobus sp.]
MKYKFPRGMRISKLEEREKFYREEFDLVKVENWLSWRDIRNTAFAVIIGRKTNVYLQKFYEKKDKALIITDHKDLNGVLDYILYYLPEGVYYDRNLYRDLSLCENCSKDCWDCENFLGQELAFDLDPENVDCPYHGSLEDKVARKDTVSFCMIEFKKVRKNALRLFGELSEEYKKMEVVFSGRGFHIHVLDEKAFKLSREERREIAEQYSNFGIDEWVTSGEMRLIRLPYSLNALVSRICEPLRPDELHFFDPRFRAKPSFMRS